MTPSTNLGRQLFYGSVPDHVSNFDPRLGPIGSGRPIGKASNDPHLSGLKDAYAKLIKPKVSKFAKLFPSSKPIVVDELIQQIIGIINLTDTAILEQHRPQRDAVQAKHPKPCPRGDMSNLRPNDRGMDTTTCIKFYQVSTVSDDEMPLVGTESNNSVAPVKKVTFDLGAQLATQSTEEQKANCRARGRELVNSEAVAARRIHGQVTRMLREDDDEISRHTTCVALTSLLNCDWEIVEQSTITAESEVEQKG